ncbi:MAG TPA: hypothetical protein PKD12_12710 [Nitrospira sp.]|nr:hypothetical protein [Nitrospira sp.]
MAMKHKQALQLILWVMVLSGCGFDRESQLIVDHQRAVYESLALQDQLQQQGGGHAAADLGIGISNQGMVKLLSLLKGLVISPTQPPEGLEDLSVRIEDIQLVSRAGRSELELRVSVASFTNHLEFDARMTGDLLFLPPEPDGDTTEDQLAFRVKVRELHPDLSWYSMRFQNIAVVRDYLRNRLIDQIEKDLVVKVPTAKLDKLVLGLSGSEVLKDEEKGFQIKIVYASPKFEMPVVARYSQFLMTDSGFWIFARYGDKTPYIPKPVVRVPTEQLETEIGRLTYAIRAAAVGLTFASGDSTVIVRKPLLEKLTAQFNERSSDERTVSFQSTRSRGKLFEKQWRDHLLGDGGLSVELDSRDAAWGTVTLKQITSAWSEKGLTYSASVDLEANSIMYVHFDPLIGGGVGKRTTLEGTASPVLAGTLSFALHTYAGVPVLVVVNRLDCLKFPITVMDDGDLSVGVTLSQLVGGGKPNLIPALMGLPKMVKADRVLRGIKAVTVTAPKPFAAITYAPTQFLADANGFRAEFSMLASWSEGDDVHAEDRVKEITALVNKDETFPSGPDCGKPDPIKVHVAGISFERDLGLGRVITSLVDGAKTGTKGVENFLSTAGRNAINPSPGSVLRKPLVNPLGTLKCLGTLLQKCE